MTVTVNALKPTQVRYTYLLAKLQCAYYHRSKAQITAMTVAPLIADSQLMVGVSESVAPASQLKVYRF